MSTNFRQPHITQCSPTQSYLLQSNCSIFIEVFSLLIPDGRRVTVSAGLDMFTLVTICLFLLFSNLIFTAGRVDITHFSPSRSCSSLLIVPVFCHLVAKPNQRAFVPDVDCLGSSGCNNIMLYSNKKLPASPRETRYGCTLVGPFQQWKCSPLCERAAVSSAPTPGEQPLGLQRSRRNIISSYTRFSPLLMPQLLAEPSTTSPPCLLRNYILLWGSPRCGLLLVSELGERKKGVGEKEFSVCLNKGRYAVSAGWEWEFYWAWWEYYYPASSRERGD